MTIRFRSSAKRHFVVDKHFYQPLVMELGSSLVKSNCLAKDTALLYLAIPLLPDVVERRED